MNDVRLISSVAVCAMLAIALIGTEWESKVSLVNIEGYLMMHAPVNISISTS